MEGVLPVEFPFSRRREVCDEVAQTVASTPVVPQGRVSPVPAQELATPAVAAPAVAQVEHVEEETLVEIAAAGHVVYRGRERRRSPRQALRAKAVYRDESKTAASGAVQVVNISMFGVRVWSPRPLQPGDRGHIRLELGPLKWASPVRVVAVETNEDDGYIAGCEFIAKELPRRRVDAA